MEDNRFIFSVLVILSLVFFLSLSGVSAASYTLTEANTTEEFQHIIDTDSDSDLEINLASGTYDGFTQINVTRNATIRGQGAGTVINGDGGTLFNVLASNVSIINLTITGYGTAISSNASNLTVKGNNISTNGNSISLVSTSSSNPITGVVIEDNVIISSVSGLTSGAVYLSGVYTDKAVFDVLLRGNTITTTRIQANGFYLGDSNTNTVFSSANLIFENNNITATGTFGAGVRLLALGSNNANISFANNNITGRSGGVSLYTYDSNNANITFSNNTIIGTGTNYPGVDLYAFSSTNTNITFAENDIFGEKYGVYVYASDGNVKDLMFLNNNITANGNAFYFSSYPSSVLTNISNFVVKGNNIIARSGVAFNFTALNESSRINVTVEYNRILSLLGVDIDGLNDNSSFDYNWWGVNDITGKLVGINTNNHYILNITNSTSLDDVKVGDTLNFALLVLNTTKTNVGVGKLPYFVINGTFNGVNYTINRDDLFLYNFIIRSELLQTVTAKLDDEYVVLTFNATKGNFIVDIDVKKNGDGSVDVTVTVTDEDGDPLGGHEVEINLNGKIVGTVITNKNGKAYFHIPVDKLINGENTVTVTVNGDDSFNTAIKSISFIIDKKNETNGTNNTGNSVASAVMKKTGMPITPLIATPLIAILLVLVSLVGVNLRRKD